GKELHLDLDDPVALGGLTAAPLDVEGEAAWTIAAHLRFRHRGEEVADVREHAGVGGRVGPRRPADRRLVDVDRLVHVLQALYGPMGPGPVLGPVEVLRQLAREDVADKGGLA